MTRKPLVIVKQNRTVPQPQRLPTKPLDYTPPVVDTPTPIATAELCLGTRLKDHGERGYYLDGQPARLDAIMRATNRVLKSRRLEQVGKNKEWLVD